MQRRQNGPDSIVTKRAMGCGRLLSGGVALVGVAVLSAGCSSSGTSPTTVPSTGGSSGTQPTSTGSSDTLSPKFFNGTPTPGPGNTK